MIEWIFIDIGNVLFNDDPQNFHGYRLAYESIRAAHPGYTFDEMLAEREELARRGSEWNLAKIMRRHLSEEEVQRVFAAMRAFLIEHYDENHLLSDGLFAVLDALRSQWRLGIIANQMPECRRSLARRGLLGFFDVIAISDELDLHKPDVRLYEWALAQAGCEPSRGVMIGDRRDNDIAPAQKLSMQTILVCWPDSRSKGWNPADPLAQAFLDSCDRIPLFSALPAGPAADRTISVLREAPAAVAALAAARKAAAI